jgi:hypothetical protein
MHGDIVIMCVCVTESLEAKPGPNHDHYSLSKEAQCPMLLRRRHPTVMCDYERDDVQVNTFTI